MPSGATRGEGDEGPAIDPSRVATLAPTMWAARQRHSGLGMLLLGVTVALLMAWLRLSHGLFAPAAGLIVLVVTALLAARDGWRQTSPESLTSRGIRPDSVRGFNVMDPGLRREIVPIIPGAVTRRMSSARTRRPAAPSAGDDDKGRPNRPESPGGRNAPAGCHDHPRR
jgi:hypothetical protein